MYGYKALKDEMRLLGDWYDPWGEAMGQWFKLCDVLTFERDVVTPAHWGFHPSPMGSTNEDDDCYVDMMRETETDALIQYGNLLERYTRLCTHLGKDY